MVRQLCAVCYPGPVVSVSSNRIESPWELVTDWVAGWFRVLPCLSMESRTVSNLRRVTPDMPSSREMVPRDRTFSLAFWIAFYRAGHDRVSTALIPRAISDAQGWWNVMAYIGSAPVDLAKLARGRSSMRHHHRSGAGPNLGDVSGRHRGPDGGSSPGRRCGRGSSRRRCGACGRAEPVPRRGQRRFVTALHCVMEVGRTISSIGNLNVKR